MVCETARFGLLRHPHRIVKTEKAIKRLFQKIFRGQQTAIIRKKNRDDEGGGQGLCFRSTKRIYKVER